MCTAGWAVQFYLMPLTQMANLQMICMLRFGKRGEKNRKRRRVHVALLSPVLFVFLLLPVFTPSSLPISLVFQVCSQSRPASVPQFEEAVPGSCADAHAVLGDAGAAHPVVMARQYAWRRRAERHWTKLEKCKDKEVEDAT